MTRLTLFFDWLDEAAGGLIRIAYLLAGVTAVAVYFGAGHLPRAVEDPLNALLPWALSFAVETHTYITARRIRATWQENMSRTKGERDWGALKVNLGILLGLLAFSAWNQLGYLEATWTPPLQNILPLPTGIAYLVRALVVPAAFMAAAFLAPLAEPIHMQITREAQSVLTDVFRLAKRQRRRMMKQAAADGRDMTGALIALVGDSETRRIIGHAYHAIGAPLQQNTLPEPGNAGAARGASASASASAPSGAPSVAAATLAPSAPTRHQAMHDWPFPEEVEEDDEDLQNLQAYGGTPSHPLSPYATQEIPAIILGDRGVNAARHTLRSAADSGPWAGVASVYDESGEDDWDDVPGGVATRARRAKSASGKSAKTAQHVVTKAQNGVAATRALIRRYVEQVMNSAYANGEVDLELNALNGSGFSQRMCARRVNDLFREDGVLKADGKYITIPHTTAREYMRGWANDTKRGQRLLASSAALVNPLQETGKEEAHDGEYQGEQHEAE